MARVHAVPAGQLPAPHVHCGDSHSRQDADYEDKDPIDVRPIVHKRINGGISSPARWDEKTMGFSGTDRMRHYPDSAGFRRTAVPDA